jgi:hypothetical protein
VDQGPLISIGVPDPVSGPGSLQPSADLVTYAKRPKPHHEGVRLELLVEDCHSTVYKGSQNGSPRWEAMDQELTPLSPR